MKQRGSSGVQAEGVRLGDKRGEAEGLKQRGKGERVTLRSAEKGIEAAGLGA